MNNYYGNTWSGTTGRVLSQVQVNAFLQRVFVIMAAGLAITGLAAYFFFNLFFFEDGSRLGLTDAGAQAFGTPLRYLIMFAPFIMVLVLSFGIQRLSYMAATLVFVAYCGLMGLSLSWILAIYTFSSIATTFFITAGMFAALALYGLTTKRDLTKLGSILFMALIGLIIASVVNWFLGSSALQWLISVAGVVIFSGLTAYDVQNLNRLSVNMDTNSELGQKASLLGALSLYLNFINLFLFLLQLMGGRRD